MGAFKKADFYYGAFLSLLLNKGLTPFLIEKNGISTRRRFEITTDNDSYEFYCKYVTNSTGKDNPLWAFGFAATEIEELETLLQSSKKVIFALICSQKDTASSMQELALVDKEDFVKCVSLRTYKESTPRINVKMHKNKSFLSIYGNNRADRIGTVDNTIKIDRDRITKL